VRRIVLVVMCMAVAVASLAADGETRMFQLRHRPAREAAVVVEPLLSNEGSILIQPRQNRITVRDSGSVLTRVQKALDGWDVPPASFVIQLRVLEASKEKTAPAARKTPAISGLGAELGTLFQFGEYRELAALRMVVSEGMAIEVPAGDRFHLRFVLRTTPLTLDSVDLTEFQLSRREWLPDGTERLAPMMRARVNLRLRQESILGGAGSEDAERALFLVLLAEREQVR